MKNILKLSLVALGIFLATISMSTNLQANENDTMVDGISISVCMGDASICYKDGTKTFFGNYITVEW